MTILAIALIAIGVTLTSVGVLRLMTAARGARATGTITGTSSTATRLNPFKDASFTFTTADGTEHSVWSPSGTETGPGLGRTVQVRHEVGDPAKAEVVPPFPQALVFFMIGDVLLIAGILIFVL